MYEKSSTLPWSEKTWNRIHTAVNDEVRRVAIAPKFLPICSVAPDALTEPSHGIAFDNQNRLWIDEAPVVRIIELWSDFALTPQQLAEEDILTSARTLAIRAANFICCRKKGLEPSEGGPKSQKSLPENLLNKKRIFCHVEQNKRCLTWGVLYMILKKIV